MTQNSFSFREYWKKHHLAILGVALTAVCALYAFLPYHFPLKPSTETKSTEPNTNKEKATHDTPEKIVAEIELVPPLQRDDVAKAYIGIPVDWELFFAHGQPENKKYRLLLCSSPLLAKSYVSFSVPIENNEYLRRLPENSKLRVQGEIDSISGKIITLKNANIIQ